MCLAIDVKEISKYFRVLVIKLKCFKKGVKDHHHHHYHHHHHKQTGEERAPMGKKSSKGSHSDLFVIIMHVIVSVSR